MLSSLLYITKHNTTQRMEKTQQHLVVMERLVDALLLRSSYPGKYTSEQEEQNRLNRLKLKEFESTMPPLVPRLFQEIFKESKYKGWEINTPSVLTRIYYDCYYTITEHGKFETHVSMYRTVLHGFVIHFSGQLNKLWNGDLDCFTLDNLNTDIEKKVYLSSALVPPN